MELWLPVKDLQRLCESYTPEGYIKQWLETHPFIEEPYLPLWLTPYLHAQAWRSHMLPWLEEQIWSWILEPADCSMYVNDFMFQPVDNAGLARQLFHNRMYVSLAHLTWEQLVGHGTKRSFLTLTLINTKVTFAVDYMTGRARGYTWFMDMNFQSIDDLSHWVLISMR